MDGGRSNDHQHSSSFAFAQLSGAGSRGQGKCFTSYISTPIGNIQGKRLTALTPLTSLTPLTPLNLRKLNNIL